MAHQPASPALAHIRVLDLTRVRSGPTAVRQLADWGADVIKIEQPASLEADGSLGAGRNTADWQNLQRNRRSLTLNLKDEEGKELFRKLAATADVVVENFRPDVKDRLGIDYECLKAINPRIILASISGFGQTGPYAKRPGFDQIAQGMGGLMSITGDPEGGPMRVGIPIADLTTGLFCAIGVLTALLEREKSGEGQWLHTSLLQSQIFMLDFQAARYVMRGEVAAQVGNEHPTSVPTNRYLTTDGAINIAVAGDETWRRLCTALGRDEWAEDENLTNNAKRAERRDKLNADIAEIVAKKSTADWVSELTEAGVPCGPIYRIDEMFEDPQVQHLNVAQPIHTDPFGETKAMAQPFELTRTPSSFAASPPTRGQHTNEILEELGLSAEECAELEKKSVI
ncbi:MAG: CaiB/BaiF CoA-transferase family protein [Rhizobiaceae bacterium]